MTAIAQGEGKFIVFEGTDGSGLTTHASCLQKWLQSTSGRRVHATKEPTGGPIGALIRLRLTGRLEVDDTTFALMFAADRMDHLRVDIEPKLRQGEHVICDRYVLSTLAYQSLTLNPTWISEINAPARRPDLTIFIDVPTAVSLERIATERWNAELFETETTLTKVKQNYYKFIAERKAAGENIVVVQGCTGNKPRPLAEVEQEIRTIVEALLETTESATL
jgi:dTMP kinase